MILKFFVGSKEVVVSSEVHFYEIISSIVLTRRIMLANVARIFDPVGFLVSIILRANDEIVVVLKAGTITFRRSG